MDRAQTENQKSGNLGTVVDSIRGHTSTSKDLFETGMALPGDPRVAELVAKLPGRLETAVEDLRTVSAQLDKLRQLANEKGYPDVLEVLEEKLPYDRGYD